MVVQVSKKGLLTHTYMDMDMDMDMDSSCGVPPLRPRRTLRAPRNPHFVSPPDADQMLSLSLSSAAFSLSPSLGAPRLLRATGVRMADGEKPMKSANESPLSAVTDTLSKLPWNDLLLGFVTLDCAHRLTDSVPALFGPSPNYFGTGLDVLFVGYGTVELAKKAGLTPPQPQPQPQP